MTYLNKDSVYYNAKCSNVEMFYNLRKPHAECSKLIFLQFMSIWPISMHYIEL